MRSIPRLRFAHLPTPVESLSWLSDELGGPQLLVKRDDLTGLAFGGNKTRKLEFLLADAQSQGARTLITAGAVQSNHCRQTAAAAARFGLECILVLAGEIPQVYTANLLLDHLLGANLVWCLLEERDQTLQEIFTKSKESGGQPYLIPYGGSNPVGAAAYAFAIKEMLDQGVNPDWIVFGTSSGGTQAGLVAGARLMGYRGQIAGISIDQPALVLRERIARLAEEVIGLFGEKIYVSSEEILVIDEYLGEGYGYMGEAEKEAIRLFARFEGLLLDPVYTGRAAAGLIDMIRKRYFEREANVLFWHTGGGPALFADRYRELGLSH